MTDQDMANAWEIILKHGEMLTQIVKSQNELAELVLTLRQDVNRLQEELGQGR